MEVAPTKEAQEELVVTSSAGEARVVTIPFFEDRSVVVLGDVEGGKAILSTVDKYVEGLSDFERGAKLQRSVPPSLPEFTKFQADQVIPFTELDLQYLELVVKSLASRVKKFSKLGSCLPPKILINLTTGLEEGGAAYCRGLNGIFLPRNMLDWDSLPEFDSEERLVAHELWHIISRNLEPSFRDDVYRVIHYEPFGHVLDHPPALKPLKISNPDAVVMEHYVDITSIMGENAEPTGILPIMFSSSPMYEEGSGNTFFSYLVLAFMIVRRGESEGKVVWEPVVNDEGLPLMVDRKQLPPPFWRAIGRNTSYIHHPEETVADNWMHLAMGHKDQTDVIPNPELLDHLALLLGETQTE